MKVDAEGWAACFESQVRKVDTVVPTSFLDQNQVRLVAAGSYYEDHDAKERDSILHSCVRQNHNCSSASGRSQSQN